VSFQDELSKQLQIILNDKDKDFYSLNPINSMLYVKTDAEKMRAIEKFVETLNNDFSKEVVTTITIFGVSLDKNHQYGVDWSYVSSAVGDTGDYKKMFGTNSELYTPSSPANGIGEGSVFKLGSNNGIGALVKAVSQFGTTTSVHKDTLILTNNHPMVHSLGNTKSYISKVTYVSSTSITSGAMMEREQAEVYDGLYLFFKPTVMEDDTVRMTLRLSMSKVNDIIKQEFSDGTYVQSPDVNKINLNHYVTLRSGDKLVIGGILAKEDSKKYKGLMPTEKGGEVAEAIAPLMGQKQSGESTVEYIVVVEAKIKEI
jgi:type II secretory pathway component GspD/PulD (secretin)